MTGVYRSIDIFLTGKNVETVAPTNVGRTNTNTDLEIVPCLSFLTILLPHSICSLLSELVNASRRCSASDINHESPLRLAIAVRPAPVFCHKLQARVESLG
jgi:hypothetical protein